MSSSHKSAHHGSSSSHKSKGSSHGSRSKSKKEDWSEITDPEERRRVQNRNAQRKFRDRAKETRKRQDREEENQANASHTYHTPDAATMLKDEELSGLPWGSLSLKHVVGTRYSQATDSRGGSSREEEGIRSPAEESTYTSGSGQAYYTEAQAYYYGEYYGEEGGQ